MKINIIEGVSISGLTLSVLLKFLGVYGMNILILFFSFSLFVMYLFFNWYFLRYKIDQKIEPLFFISLGIIISFISILIPLRILHYIQGFGVFYLVSTLLIFFFIILNRKKGVKLFFRLMIFRVIYLYILVLLSVIVF